MEVAPEVPKIAIANGQSAPEAIELSAFFDTYVLQPAAADAKYKGQTLFFTGRVDQADAAAGTIVLRGANGGAGLTCFLKEAARANEVKVGDSGDHTR